MASRIYLYTGDGEGKTAAAVGHALRKIGHGKKVVMIQFMKGRKNIGELLAADVLKNLEIHQFGRAEFVNFEHPEEIDIEKAKRGLEFAGEVLAEKPDLLILDEANTAIYYKLLETKDVLDFLEKVPASTAVILTGRGAPQELIDKADVVTEMRLIKYEKAPAEKGLEY
jgi:cob(I)alamin adenosyltransferase